MSAYRICASRCAPKFLLNFDVPSSVVSRDGIPHGRYLSKIGMLSNVNSIYKSYNVDGRGPMIVAFGGDGALLHNTLANSLFDDVWLLSPGGISSSSMNQHHRDQRCDWRWIPGSTASQTWNSTCGADASEGEDRLGECRAESILIAAWCQGQYQSL